jgi:hypothetical protein
MKANLGGGSCALSLLSDGPNTGAAIDKERFIAAR